MEFLEIGDYGIESTDDYGKNFIAGNGDNPVWCDGCIAWGGGGDDVLVGKEKRLRPPILLGGNGGDTYSRASIGDFVIVADLQGGLDTLDLAPIRSNKIDVYKLRGKDFLICRKGVAGSKYPAALLIDPLGEDSNKHRIEKFVFQDQTFSLRRFKNHLKRRIAGHYSYKVAADKGILNLSNIGLKNSTKSVESAIIDIKHNERLLSSFEKIDKKFSTKFSESILSADNIFVNKQFALMSEDESYKTLNIYINQSKRLDLAKFFSEKITPALDENPLSQRDSGHIEVYLPRKKSSQVTIKQFYCDEYSSLYRRSIWLEGSDLDDTFKVKLAAERAECTENEIENERWISGNSGKDTVEILDNRDELRISSTASKRRFIYFDLDEDFYDSYEKYEYREGIIVYDDVENIILNGRVYSFEKLFSRYK